MTSNNIYWCDQCGVPLLREVCDICLSQGRRFTSDLKPVFAEERAFHANHIGAWQMTKLPLELLWIQRKTIYFCGHPYLKLNAKGELKKKCPAFEDPESVTQPTQLPSLNTMIQANATAIASLKEDSIRFIKDIVSRYPRKKPVVSFSGGKDSTVVSDLVREALGTDDIIHVFGDTTIEYPDTYTYVQQFQERHPQIKFVIEKAPHDWFEMCKAMEPPSQILRWCCSVFKSVPLAKAMKSVNGSGGVISFEGIRYSESRARRFSEQIYPSKKIAHQVSARPILDWNDLSIWLYSLSLGELNDVYRKGLSRAGCLYCPSNSPFTDYLLQYYYPVQMSKWLNWLKDFAKQVGKSDPEGYVSTGNWKKRSGGVSGATQVYLKRYGRPCEGDTETRYLLTQPTSSLLCEMMKPLGTLSTISDPKLGYYEVCNYDTGEPLFRFQALPGEAYMSVVLLITKGRRLLLARIERQIKKFQTCVQCGSCAAVCPTGAISTSSPLRIDDEKCTRCLKCSRLLNRGCVALNSMYGNGRKKET